MVMYDILDDSVEGAWVCDRDYHILYWNRSMERVSGILRDRALGGQLFELMPFLVATVEEGVMKEALQGRSAVGEARVLGQPEMGRRSAVFQASYSPVREEGGQVRGILALYRQVTLEKSAGIIRKERLLLEKSPIALAVFRNNGDAVYFNQSFLKIFADRLGEIEGFTTSYNLLKDVQLERAGLSPYLRKGLTGAATSLPTFRYFTARKHKERYIKGFIFPLKGMKGDDFELAINLQDVTNEKRISERLAKVNRKFKKLASNLPGVIYEYKVNEEGKGQYLYLSKGCERMFGLRAKELMAEPNLIENLVHDDDRKSFKKSVSESSATGRSWQWEGRVVIRGKVKWIRGLSSPDLEKSGEKVWYGILMDISERKQWEKHLRESEGRYRRLIEHSPLGIVVQYNEEIVFANPASAKMLGAKDDQGLIGRQALDFVHSSSKEAVFEKVKQVMRGETSPIEEERFVKVDGTVIDVELMGIPFEYQGKVGVQNIMWDVSDRKQKDSMIKKNELLFTQLFQNSPIGVVLLDKNYQAVQVNRGFENIFGYTKKEVIGSSLNPLIIPDTLEQESFEMNELTRIGEISTLETVRRHKNRKDVPVIVYGVPIHFDSKIIGVYGIYVDISERKKIEEELKVRNTELDHFVYKVSHDLRAPLSSILGLVYLAKHEENDDDIMEYIGIIENRVKELDRFISDVLSHSKNLKVEVTTSEIDFEQVIQHCFKELSYLEHADKISREVTIAADNGVFYSDVWRINEIFRNLISNAIKYVDLGRPDHFIKIDIKVSPSAADILLEDNGIGISGETLPRIFEMFYRATERSEGSGIGLYIVKNAIEKIGGSISIRSQVGQGTAFKISIPNRFPG